MINVAKAIGSTTPKFKIFMVNSLCFWHCFSNIMEYGLFVWTCWGKPTKKLVVYHFPHEFPIVVLAVNRENWWYIYRHTYAFPSEKKTKGPRLRLGCVWYCELGVHQRPVTTRVAPSFYSNEIVYISLFCAPPFVWFCFVESPHFTHWIDQSFRSTISVISGHAHEIQQRKGFEPLAHPWLGRQDSAADRRIAACQSVKSRAATVVVGSNGGNMLK
jgi:hypothetical protein